MIEHTTALASYTSFMQKTLISLLVCTLCACGSILEGSKVDYKTQGKPGPGLEVPPDLSQLTKDARAAVPRGGVVNASEIQGTSVQTATGSASNTVTGNIALGTLGDVRVQRDANQRWLLVARSPDKLWNEVRAFWLDNGFTLVLDQSALGIMETEWNENRGKLPKDGVRRVLGRLFDGLYSTNERDKYRTRLERTADGFTEIFISHKGMAEDFTTSAQEQLKWKVRPVDPELEAEFLKRLMIRLGSDTAAAQAALGAQTAAPSVRAKLTQESGKSNLLLSDPIDQAWRRVGLSLDRSSFTVEDRDRSKGIYFVRYMAAKTDTPSPGFFARLFGTTAKESMQKYQILLSSEANQTKVSVADLQGVALQTPEATRILQVLADDLK